MIHSTVVLLSVIKSARSPLYIQANPGNSAVINCSHSIQNYNVMLWYKRSEDRQLQLLGYMYTVHKDQNCTLTIKKLNVSSSAVYFCAASFHSDAYHCSSVQKPQPSLKKNRVATLNLISDSCKNKSVHFSEKLVNFQ
uniref:Immunoglobulin domain-containing protein n=1 Tax=Cyprinodon variegatus TaxID=28743 RepID=A0A3Q2D5W5_CYPVA